MILLYTNKRVTETESKTIASLEIYLFLQETKVVLLEDLAAHFKMKTQDTIDRVTKLSAEGLLTGNAHKHAD